MQWLAALTTSLLSGITHAAAAGWGVALLNRTAINYAAMVRPDQSSIVVACIRWVQRTFTEAPALLEHWNAEREEWAQVVRDELLDLLETPNPYYNGSTLWKATIADRYYAGTAYWVKVRSRTGRPVQLWWAPESTITPKWNDHAAPGVFITHYEYRPGGGTYELRVEDVVRFPDGIDPANSRKGLSAMKSLFREIFTDDEAANMTASLLRNMGVPGVIISPKQGTIAHGAAEKIKATYKEKFSGDNKGEPMVMEGQTEINTFGFSPEQMQLRALRGLPEERITSVIGVNAAVVGLGAGLSTTKVGATLREYREEAFESTIIPMYRELSSELTHQLLPDFKSGVDWRVAFDLSKIRVLQDDENKRAERVIKVVNGGLASVAEGRRALGFIALPEHEVYLRSRNTIAVPAGTSPEDQAAQNALPAPAAPGGQLAAAMDAAIREALAGVEA